MAYSPYLARVLRGAALKERAMAYIQAGEVQGFSSWWLCFRHLLPNISSLIVAQGTIFFGFAVVDLAALSFLGLGIQPPQADWGVMVSEGKTPLLQGYPLEALAAVDLHRARRLGGELPRRAAPGAVHGGEPMSALLQVHDLTVDLAWARSCARSSPAAPSRSGPARRWGWSASPARASR